MRVCVVVPAFNNWALTRDCIERLRATTAADVLADVVVVDDGSNDGVSAAWTAAQRSFTPVLATRNRGFSVACNLGAAAGHGDVLLFLNNDAFTRPGSIEAMLAALARQPSIGIVGAKLLYADGSLQHAGLALLDGPVSRWWHVHRQLPGSFPDADIARDLPAVTGAALMIRRSLFAALGGFDEGFTNGWEDVDLCLRAWCRGSRVRYEPRAAIEHLESATLGRSHDDAANEARFIGRWATVLATAPRYPLAEIPPIALAVPPDCAGDDRWARDHLEFWWGAKFGARVGLTKPASRVDRARVEVGAALAKRRPTLEVSLGEATRERATGPVRVAYVAPSAAADARAAVAAPNVAAWWTPTVAARDALVAAGAPLERIAVLPLGAAAAAPALVASGDAGLVVVAARTGPVVVAARDVDADLLHALNARAPHLRTMVLRAGETPAFAAIDVVLARNGGDRWGLLVPAALAHGCFVVVSPPLDAFIAAAPGVVAVGNAGLLDALRDLVGDPGALRAAVPAVRLAARRQLGATLQTQRAAQAARALVHGAPSSALVEVGPALAAHFRAASLGSTASFESAVALS